jgi:hypothetical protein
MTPIERTQAKSVALKTLGLGLYANPAEIRDAWRRIAFETHPDRNAAAQADFARAKEAYDFLRNEWTTSNEGSGAWTRPRAASQKVATRPSILARLDRLAEDVVDVLRAEFTAEGGPSRVIDLCAGGASQDGARTDHLPVAVHRHGRHLTYIVEATTERGLNRVALPATLLDGTRKVRPVVVVFDARVAGEGEVKLPDAVVAQAFPGARGVEIRFALP